MNEKTITRFRWASRILGLLGLLGGILAAAKQLPGEVQHYAALATALLIGAARWCEQQIPARKTPAGQVAGGAAVVLGLLLIGIAAAGCGRFAAARTTIAVTAAATDVANSQVLSCDKAKPACVKAQKAWPAIYTSIVGALQAARAAVDIAEQVARDKVAGDPPDYLGHIKRAVCALSGAVAGILRAALPKQGAEVARYLSFVGAATCQ
jgi:hypothetical protein